MSSKHHSSYLLSIDGTIANNPQNSALPSYSVYHRPSVFLSFDWSLKFISRILAYSFLIHWFDMKYVLPNSNDVRDEIKSFRKLKNGRRCNIRKQLNIQSLFKQKCEICKFATCLDVPSLCSRVGGQRNWFHYTALQRNIAFPLLNVEPWVVQYKIYLLMNMVI